MRKITFGVANSLDNFIARPDHSADWIMWSDEAMAEMTTFWSNIDTVLVGRKTYEVMRQMSQGQDESQSSPYPDVKSFVFSRTLPPGPMGDAVVVGEDAAEFVRGLKRQRGKDIYVMGGGELARALFAADLIDEVGVNIHPLLLGAGIPLFHALPRQINLALLEAKPLRTAACR